MKKYFLADSEDEVVFGDVLQLVFTKANGTSYYEHECSVKLSPDNVRPLIEAGVIKEKKVKEKHDKKDNAIDFAVYYPEYQNIEKRLDTLEGRINLLREALKFMNEGLIKLTEILIDSEKKETKKK